MRSRLLIPCRTPECARILEGILRDNSPHMLTLVDGCDVLVIYNQRYRDHVMRILRYADCWTPETVI